MSTYFFAPENTVPLTGTVQRQMLDLIANSDPVERKALVEIDDNFRRILQELEGERFGYWAIDRIHEGGSIKATHFQLNHRHFESHEGDAMARRERCVELRRDSLDQAMRESGRVQQAFEEYEEAITLLEDEKRAQKKPGA